MVELNKEKEPTKQDVQQFVDSVYNYAAHLLFDEDKSDSDVIIDLVSNGGNKDDARSYSFSKVYIIFRINSHKAFTLV